MNFLTYGLLIFGVGGFAICNVAYGYTENTHATSIGSYFYNGCYSRKNFGFLMAKGNSKVILYNHILAWENCFELCSDYSSQFPPENINVIAVQLRSCICISVPPPTKDVILYKVADYHCDQIYLAERYNLGGNFAFAVYCKYDKACLHEITEAFPEYELIGSETDNDVINNTTTVDFEIPPCVTENCTTRLDIDGQICGKLSTTGNQGKTNELSETIKVLNGYIPECETNPNYCLKYCKNQYIHNLNDENTQITKYSVLSIISGYYQDIGFCHCTDDLQTIYSMRFEMCEQCSNTDKHCMTSSGNPLNTKNIIYINGNIIEPEVTTTGRVICNSLRKCSATDIYGTNWSACPGELKKQKCPNTVEFNSTGWSHWQCSLRGKFIEEQPDFTNCTTNRLINILNNLETKEKKSNEILSDLRDMVIPRDGNVTKYFAHEILLIDTLVRNISRAVFSSQTNDGELKGAVEDAVIITSNLIANEAPWSQLNNKSRSRRATDLTFSVENLLFQFAEDGGDNSLNLSSSGYTVHPIENDKEGFVATLFKKIEIDGISNSIKFPPNSEASYIKLLNTSKLDVSNGPYYVGLIMNSTYLNSLTPPSQNSLENAQSGETKSFNGDIISLTFSNQTTSNAASANGVQIKIVHDTLAVGQVPTNFGRKLHPGEKRKAVLGRIECVYWDTVNLTWSTLGCVKQTDRSNSQYTVCKCTHLTAFALLTENHEYIGKEWGLEMLTLILCPASIFCLIATIICMRRWAILNKERTTIVTHLCANLTLGNVLLLLLVDKNYFYLPQNICTMVGMMTHYVFLAAFGWMAAQGLYLYRMVVTVFSTGNDHFVMYAKGAYLYPIFPVGLTSLIGFGVGDQPYGGEMFCWLNGNYIWAFKAPAAIILVGNCIAMIITMRVLRLRNNSKLKNVPFAAKKSSNYKKLIHGSVSLSILLGLTWIVGFFALLDAPMYFVTYLFTILNASQGISIFIFHCVLHKKFKIILKRKFDTMINRTSKNQKHCNTTSIPDKSGQWSVTTGLLSDSMKCGKMGSCVQAVQIQAEKLVIVDGEKTVSRTAANNLDTNEQDNLSCENNGLLNILHRKNHKLEWEISEKKKISLKEIDYKHYEKQKRVTDKDTSVKESNYDKNIIQDNASLVKILNHNGKLSSAENIDKALIEGENITKGCISQEEHLQTTESDPSNMKLINSKKWSNTRFGDGKVVIDNYDNIRLYMPLYNKDKQYSNNIRAEVNLLERVSGLSIEQTSHLCGIGKVNEHGNAKEEKQNFSGKLRGLFLVPYKEEMITSKLYLKQSEKLNS